MILGIGSDLVRHPPHRALARALRRALHPPDLHGRGASAQRAAGRACAVLCPAFRAKEACSKALGTGLRSGVFWRDMEVVNQPSGQPTMRLSGGALERLKAMTPPGHEAVVHVSLTDDPPLAQAFVVIEARPR
jgi:holo-[acyl-carrier protein] synthase